MIVDPYQHVGEPRFTDAATYLASMQRWGIARSAAVLFFLSPDLAGFAELLRLGRGRVAGIGAPIGDTPAQRADTIALCLRAGALGIRVQGDDHLNDRDALEPVGERGGVLYACDPLRSPAHTDALLAWLERHPAAAVVLPHFVHPDPTRLATPQAELLLAHARVYPILSRWGQCGSREGWPHRDLKPWIEALVARCTWGRVMLGSEWPVCTARGERPDRNRAWLDDLGLGLDAATRAAVLGGTADRVLFGRPQPEPQPITIPAWLPAWADSHSPPVLLAANGMKVPVATWRRLHAAWLAEEDPAKPATFLDFLARRLESLA
jgi:hypothetical protein